VMEDILSGFEADHCRLVGTLASSGGGRAVAEWGSSSKSGA